jgi:hypothetical protein
METIEELYQRNRNAKFKLAKGRNRIFSHFWKTKGKTTFSATCLMGNRVKLEPNEIVIEIID